MLYYSNHSCKVFLPDSHYDVFGISAEVDKEHRRLVGKSTQECINDVIDGCTRLLTYQGVFFDVSVSLSSQLKSVANPRTSLAFSFKLVT